MDKALKALQEFAERKAKFLSAKITYEDYKKDLETSLDAVCDAWQECVKEFGVSDDACIAWQFSKGEIERELRAICVLVD